MNRILFSAALALTAFSCTAAELKTIDTTVTEAEPILQCVISQIEGGASDPLAIGIACGGVAATTVIQIARSIESLGETDAGPVPGYVSAQMNRFLIENHQK